MKISTETLLATLLGFASIAFSLPTPSPPELTSTLESRVTDPTENGLTSKPLYNFKTLLAEENNKPNGGCPDFSLAATPFDGQLGAVPDSVKDEDTVSARTICPTARSSDDSTSSDVYLDRGAVESR